MVYSLKVLQEVSRDSAQACCLGSCGSLDAHAVGAARTCTMMRTYALLKYTTMLFHTTNGGSHMCGGRAMLLGQARSHIYIGKRAF